MVKDWLPQRIALHRTQLEGVRARHKESWAKNIASSVSELVPDLGPASQGDIAALRGRIPALPDEYIDFVSLCEGFPIFGLGSSNDVRVLPCAEIVALKYFDQGFIDRWLSGPAAPRPTPKYTPLERQNPHDFDARELKDAIVLIAGAKADGSVLWIPSPRREYWRVAAWEGCLRFLTIREVFDHLLGEVVSGLDAAL